MNPEQSRLERLESRLSNLERREGMYRRVCAALALFSLPATAVYATHTEAETPRATRIQAPFIVTDSQGKPLMRVDKNKGDCRLTLFQADSQPYLQAYSNEWEGVLEVLDRSGRRVITLGRLSGPFPRHPTRQGLIVYDPAPSGSGISLDIQREAEEGSVLDRRGLSIGDEIDLTTSEYYGEAMLRLHTPEAEPEFTGEQRAGVEVLDRKGRSTVSFGEDLRRGWRGLALGNQGGQKVAEIKAGAARGTLSLWGEDGQTLFRAP
jgi:hypothetical protein